MCDKEWKDDEGPSDGVCEWENGEGEIKFLRKLFYGKYKIELWVDHNFIL